jgi:hypothetical protein
MPFNLPLGLLLKILLILLNKKLAYGLDTVPSKPANRKAGWLSVRMPKFCVDRSKTYARAVGTLLIFSPNH